MIYYAYRIVMYNADELKTRKHQTICTTRHFQVLYMAKISTQSSDKHLLLNNVLKHKMV